MARRRQRHESARTSHPATAGRTGEVLTGLVILGQLMGAARAALTFPCATGPEPFQEVPPVVPVNGGRHRPGTADAGRLHVSLPHFVRRGLR